MKNKLTALLAALFVALPLTALAATATGTVKISVQGQSGPVASAKVSINSTGDSSYTSSGVTSQTGTLELSGVPVGLIKAIVYDSSGKVIATGSGSLPSQGSVVSLNITTTK